MSTIEVSGNITTNNNIKIDKMGDYCSTCRGYKGMTNSLVISISHSNQGTSVIDSYPQACNSIQKDPNYNKKEISGKGMQSYNSMK